MNNNPIFIGLIAAGVFCAMMVVFGSMGFFVLLPVFLGALPVYVAALGWGTRAGIVATLAIAAFSSIITDPANGLLIGMMIAAPAALAGHQANLAQPVDDTGGDLQWFPLSQILFWITILIIAAALVFGVMVDFDPAVLGPQLAQQIKPLMPPVEGAPEFSQEDFAKALELNMQILPFVLPSMWIGIHILNFLIGMSITRRMGVLARPPEDIADGFNLPQYALVLLIVSLTATMFTSPPLSYGFQVVAGAMVTAFSIVGLAVMHKNIRGWPTRLPVLVLTYMMISVLFFPIYMFSFTGVLKVARSGRRIQNKDSKD